jgi:antitoxin ParD1/3/4
MPVMAAELDPKLEAFVGDLVDAGRYETREAVLEEGLRLLAEREMHLAELRAEIDAALDDPRPWLSDEEVARNLALAAAELEAELARESV